MTPAILLTRTTTPAIQCTCLNAAITSAKALVEADTALEMIWQCIRSFTDATTLSNANGSKCDRHVMRCNQLVRVVRYIFPCWRLRFSWRRRSPLLGYAAGPDDRRARFARKERSYTWRLERHEWWHRWWAERAATYAV